MKKIILSAAVAAMAFSTSAVAADKGIDIDVTGQAVIYYETHSDNGTTGTVADKGLLDQANSTAAAGVQLNLGSDLGNNFTFGSQLTYLGHLGLNKQVVVGQKQSTQGLWTNANDTADQIALTKIFIAKQIGNTTLKMGRQELPKSLSPLAFSEGWNVYKNTFDAILVVNTDLPKTTVVGAYVSGGTGMGLGSTGNLNARTDTTLLATNNAAIAGEAYMLTAQTKLIPMTTLTASYYDLADVGANMLGAGSAVSADAIWIDAQIAPKNAPAGIKLALQGGQISPDSAAFSDTDAFGAKITAKVSGIALKAIYTTVSDDSTRANVTVANTGTATKSPLYSQMMYNQRAIDYANDTIVVGASYDMGDMGSIAANYGMSDLNGDNIMNAGTTDQDYNELDLVYKVKSGGVQYFAIAAIRDWDNNVAMNTTTALNTGATEDTVLRFWARYNF